jgi:diguanylate cyclase (GGDEF)-like protein
MFEPCIAVAEAIGVADLLILERDGELLRLTGGAGRGAGWAGVVEARIDDEPLAKRARERGRPVRVATGTPTRIFGPYWSPHAVLVPVGDDHLVIAGSDAPIKIADGALRRHSAEAVAAVDAVDGIPSAKLLADELEVVGAVRELMDYHPQTVAETACHIAEVAAAALSAEFAAVLVRRPEGFIVEQAGAASSSVDPRLGAALAKLSRRVSSTPLLEQDVADKGPAGRGGGVVARYALRIGLAEQLGMLVVGHVVDRPRGFTNLCQRVARQLADAAEVLLNQSIARDDLRAERDHFAREARRDPLTGLPNRVAWNEALDNEATRRARYRRPVVVMSVDVDHLKAANDQYGHDAGDELLMATAQVLRHALRNADLVARVGGDEFGVILPETHEAAMDVVVRRIEEACHNWRGSLPELRLSISVGWAAPEPFGDLRSALRAADGQMYRAKRGA